MLPPMKLLDNYVATWSVLIICVVECLVVSYIYGVSRFLSDIQAMVGYRPWPIWTACWAVLTPSILVIIIILTFINYEGKISGATSFDCDGLFYFNYSYSFFFGLCFFITYPFFIAFFSVF